MVARWDLTTDSPQERWRAQGGSRLAVEGAAPPSARTGIGGETVRGNGDGLGQEFQKLIRS